MSNELIISLLAIGFIGSLAAMFIFWAKLDEQKKLTLEERDNYKAVLSLHSAATKELDAKCVELEELEELNYCCNRKLQFWLETNEKVLAEKDALQDRLSAILCPHNDHVWELTDALRCEVRCKKCGRVKDD